MGNPPSSRARKTFRKDGLTILRLKGAATKPAAAAKTEPTKAAPAAKAPATGEELDADGHAYDAALHAATKSKTKAGLWRMKVGVARPDPKPGYPLDL
jgi:hypothetical protein